MAAGATYEPIATTTLGSAQASVTFNSFSGYTDLLLVVDAINDAGYRGMNIEFNGDSGNNYSSVYVSGNGTTTGAGRSDNSSFLDLYVTIGQTDKSLALINILNYTNTTTRKTVLTRGAITVNSRVSAGIWNSTSAITSLKVALSVDNFNTGSTFTLYGITAA